jgi:hypothetical protein
MEVLEIISSKIDMDKNLLEVQFRTISDSEDEIREDKIDYSLVLEYGYILEDETFDLFDDFYDEEDEDYQQYDEDSIEIDENELISFLNEYYMVNPDSLPKSTPF